MKKLIIPSLLLATAAQASSVFQLPDAAISVIPNYNNNTTIVAIEGVIYRGPSNYYYKSECAKPDGPRYHCNIMEEVGVVLTAEDHSQVVVNLTVQFASTLIISGHNYWRYSAGILAGDVEIP